MIVSDERLATRVGAISIAVLALAIVFFVFVYGRIEWGSHVRVRVYFHQTGGLREGAPFVVAGRTIGNVESIAFSPRGAPGPLRGDEGVAVTVAIDASDAARLGRDGDVFVASRGALSEKYLELGPAPEPGATLHEGDQLLGRDPPSLDRVLQRTWDNMTALGGFAADIKPELDALRAQVAELRGHFDTTATNLDAVIPAIDRLGTLIDDAVAVSAQARQLRETGLGGDAGLAHLSDVIARGRTTLAEARAVLDKLEASAARLGTGTGALRARLETKGPQAVQAVELAIDRVRAAIDKIDPLLAQIQAITDRIARGEGSLMKLANDPEFPEDAKELGKILKRQPWKVIGRPPDK